jgi:selenoprotein W-related protein
LVRLVLSERKEQMDVKPRVVITYCCQCQWLLRAAWMAQELLSTFADDLAGVELVPAKGGVYAIEIDGHLIWERKRDGGFPDAKLIKQKVRDFAWPDKELGHIDK